MSEEMPIYHAGPSCPDCDSRDVLRILYGLPTKQAFDAAHRGEVVLGGCVINDDDPQWSCRVCGRRFRVA